MQHISVYVPDPSHMPEPEQSPRDHPKSGVGLYIDTSKHLRLVSKEQWIFEYDVITESNILLYIASDTDSL